MRRWLCNGVVTLSSLLLVITASLWIRSYWALDGFYVELPQFGDITANDSVNLATGAGGIRLCFQRYAVCVGLRRRPQRTEPNRSWWGHGSIPPYYPVLLNPENPNNHGFSKWGFESLYSHPFTPSANGSGYGVTFMWYLLTPIWPWMLVWAIAPALYWLVIRKRRWLAKATAEGLCVTCGYDLRAHLPGQKCPECGTLVPVRGKGLGGTPCTP